MSIDNDPENLRVRSLLEYAKREMGEAGVRIVIPRAPATHRSDPLALASVSFPSEDVEREFLRLLAQKLNPPPRGL